MSSLGILSEETTQSYQYPDTTFLSVDNGYLEQDGFDSTYPSVEYGLYPEETTIQFESEKYENLNESKDERIVSSDEPEVSTETNADGSEGLTTTEIYLVPADHFLSNLNFTDIDLFVNEIGELLSEASQLSELKRNPRQFGSQQFNFEQQQEQQQNQFFNTQQFQNSPVVNQRFTSPGFLNRQVPSSPQFQTPGQQFTQPPASSNSPGSPTTSGNPKLGEQLAQALFSQQNFQGFQPQSNLQNQNFLQQFQQNQVQNQPIFSAQGQATPQQFPFQTNLQNFQQQQQQLLTPQQQQQLPQQPQQQQNQIFPSFPGSQQSRFPSQQSSSSFQPFTVTEEPDIRIRPVGNPTPPSTSAQTIDINALGFQGFDFEDVLRTKPLQSFSSTQRNNASPFQDNTFPSNTFQDNIFPSNTFPSKPFQDNTFTNNLIPEEEKNVEVESQARRPANARPPPNADPRQRAPISRGRKQEISSTRTSSGVSNIDEETSGPIHQLWNQLFDGESLKLALEQAETSDNHVSLQVQTIETSPTPSGSQQQVTRIPQPVSSPASITTFRPTIDSSLLQSQTRLESNNQEGDTSSFANFPARGAVVEDNKPEEKQIKSSGRSRKMRLRKRPRVEFSPTPPPKRSRVKAENSDLSFIPTPPPTTGRRNLNRKNPSLASNRIEPVEESVRSSGTSSNPPSTQIIDLENLAGVKVLENEISKKREEVKTLEQNIREQSQKLASSAQLEKELRDSNKKINQLEENLREQSQRLLNSAEQQKDLRDAKRTSVV